MGNTSQLVGTMRIHCPVTNSSTTNTTPLRIQNRSSPWWNQIVRLVLPLGLFLGAQNTAGRFSWRIVRPDRMISTIRNTLKKCCQPSHAGMPTGAPSGRWYSPGYVATKSCMKSRLRKNRTKATAIPARISSPSPPTMTAPAHCPFVNGP